MSKGKPLSAKFFLEGYEIPFIGATFTHTVNQASVAYIDLVPIDEMKHIKPRSMVQLFVRDITNKQSNYPYVLAWEGEVFGIAFGRTATSRSFTLKAIDYTSQWDNALVYFFDFQKSMGRGGAQVMSPIGRDETDAKKLGIKFKAITSVKSAFYLTEMEKLLRQGKDFLGAFIGLLENLTDINDFYNSSEDRLRITDRFLLQSSGALEQLLVDSNSKEWLAGIAGTRSGFFPIRQMINDFMDIIFHDHVTVPFPAKVERKAPLKKGAIESSDKIKRTIGQYQFKPNTYMLPPPACNIFFPDEYSSFQYSRDFFREPTRLIYKPILPSILGIPSLGTNHTYQPPSFYQYMYGTKDKSTWTDFEGEDDDSVSKIPDGKGGFYELKDIPGYYAEEDSAKWKRINNGSKREQNFLTNAEKIKGIWASMETMIPAALSFVTKLDKSVQNNIVEKVSRFLYYKKKYESRAVQITSQLKLSVVPGFPVLIVDDSDAKQNVIAYCESVTHRIYATQGGYTNCVLSYARDVEEQDISSRKGADPIVPDWFNESLFGSDKEDKEEKSGRRSFGEGLSIFYKLLIGDKGYRSLTEMYAGSPTVASATDSLIKEYQERKGIGTSGIQEFISKTTARNYIGMKEAFKFLGAESNDNENSDFITFYGHRLAGKYSEKVKVGGQDTEKVYEAEDYYPQSVKREVAKAIQKKLKEKRGFRG